MNEISGDLLIVILDEYSPTLPVGSIVYAHQLLEYRFRRAVLGMCLARENELDRTLRIVDHSQQAFEVSEEQVPAFIGRDSPGEPDSQMISREQLRGIGPRSFIVCCGPVRLVLIRWRMNEINRRLRSL